MNDQDKIQRTVLPIPDQPRTGLVTYDAKDPETKFPPITQLRPPKGAPNVLIVLIDDAGFGSSSAFGGPCNTPTAELLAAGGLKYNRFHTTALCSPTRQALLTGRNHHTVGMGGITEIATSAPGYNSILPNTCAPLARTLKLNGYATAQFGKCHEVPVWETSPAGPFDAWPTGGGGFEYFYGFIGGEANQWYPSLYEGTTPIEVKKTPEEGYHLMEDMTDKAINWIGQQKALIPDKPFFVYFAPGATHAPHHVPKEWADKYKGKFDQGWDKLREETFARQKKLGVIPQDCQLTQRHKEIPAWDEMPAALKPVLIRQMEVYAGFMEYTDHHVGRLVDSLKKLNLLDDTLIYYIIGDNGASAEGTLQRHIQRDDQFQWRGRTGDPRVPDGAAGQAGRPGILQPLRCGLGARHGYAVPVDQAGRLALGRHAQRDDRALAQGNPGKGRNPHPVPSRDRRRADHPGGGRAARADLRQRSAAAPDRRRQHGVLVQRCQGGRAARDTVLRDVRQPRHLPQGLDRGDAAQDAVALVGEKIPAFDDDNWELYDTSKDWSQANNLAKQMPEKLHELQRLWLIEATRYNVLPLDDRSS